MYHCCYKLKYYCLFPPKKQYMFQIQKGCCFVFSIGFFKNIMPSCCFQTHAYAGKKWACIHLAFRPTHLTRTGNTDKLSQPFSLSPVLLCKVALFRALYENDQYKYNTLCFRLSSGKLFLTHF